MNVDLVEPDVADYELPDKVGGVLSIYPMTMFDDYDSIVRRAAEARENGAYCGCRTSSSHGVERTQAPPDDRPVPPGIHDRPSSATPDGENPRPASTLILH